GLEALHITADAQFAGGHGSGFGGGGTVAAPGGSQGKPGQPPCDPASATSLPNDGSPNAYSEWENCYPWHRPVFWATAEGVYGITHRAPLAVPLLSSSTAPDVNSNVGAIGESATVIPGNQQSFDLRHPLGVSATFGFSPTVEWKVPLEVNLLYLHEQSNAIAAHSDIVGNPLLARPIFSTAAGQEGEKVYLSSFPGLAAGGVTVDTSLQLWGINGVGVVQTGLQWGDDCHGCAIDLPMGVRYLDMNEVITINNSVTALAPNFAVPFLGTPFGQGSTTVVTDSFKTDNTFLGGEFGVRLESRWNSFFLTVEPRVGIGATRQSIVIGGVSVLEQPGQATQTAPGGILAVASNSGIHTRERFTVLPEATLHIGWDVFSWMRIQAGYNIIYWENVLRAGDQISRSVDVRQVPTDFSFTPGLPGNSPGISFKESNFIIQGISLGVTFSF
ncbi:MAG TPA: BBP7 family outer membrane beta-barrel protein, partial [Gemmataceae bacterium]|nr:BBP7 family outer membrane beta-barrel protein [Gemmataceae bacterium]